MKTHLGNGIYLALLAAFFLLNSICSRADTVYVWSNDGTIQKFATNGVATMVTNNLSGWNGPVGLACDNVGNLYAGAPGDSYIWKFPSAGARSLIGYIDSVSGLAFNPAGNLFVTIPNYGEVDGLDFQLGYQYILNGLSTNHVSASAVGLAFDGSGNFYTANRTQNSVGKFSAGFADLGAFATSLNQPWGLAFDGDGNLFVANSGTNGTLKNTIVKFTTNGVRSTFATATAGLSSPQGLGFDSAGNLYVANAGNGTIVKFTTNGVASVFASGLNSPTSIAIFPGLNIWSATKIKLNDPKIQLGDALQFDFKDNAGLSFTVLGTTNVALAFTNWTVLGATTEVAPGSYEFTDSTATNHQQRYYHVRSP